MNPTSSPRSAGLSRKLRPVSKVSISDEIVEQIMGLIESGDLRPGQRLPSERELCVRFGTGRSSLREALRCLSIVGVLHARVGEGTSVAADGAKFMGRILQWRLVTEQHDVLNLLEVRRSLEGLAAARMAEHASDADRKALTAIVERMSAAVKEGVRRFAPLDVDFHLLIARGSGNALLADMISMIRGQLEKALHRILGAPDAMPRTLEEHRAILDAISRRDTAAARSRMEAHLDEAAGRFAEQMAEASRNPPDLSLAPAAVRKLPSRAPRKRAAR